MSGHRSGKIEKKAKKKHGKNGKIEWKEMTRVQAREIIDLKADCEAAERDLELIIEEKKDLSRINKALKEELATFKKMGFGKRESIRLSVLQHFYGRAVNIQVCEKDKKKFESLTEDVIHALKDVNK